jgi:hypothetical protein
LTPLGSQLDAQRFQIGDGGGLRGAVGAGAGDAAHAGHRGDADQRPRPASRIGATKGWKVAARPTTLVCITRLEGFDVLGVLGEGADGDAGVGDDDVGDAEARA